MGRHKNKSTFGNQFGKGTIGGKRGGDFSQNYLDYDDEEAGD